MFGAIFFLIIGIIRARGGLFRVIKDNILKSNWFAFLMKFLFDYNINSNSTQLKAEFRLTGQFQSLINFAIFNRRNNTIWIATKNNIFLVAISEINSKSRMEIRLVFNLAFASEFYNLEV